MRVRSCVIGLVLLLLPRATWAQDPGSVGLSMGYPSIGLIWQISEQWAVRPEFSFTRSTSESNSPVGGDAQSWSVSTGASVLFYLTEKDRLRTYLSPRIEYGRSHVTSSFSSPFLTTDNEAIGSLWNVAGSFGAQYALSDRFSAFGEVGLSYARQSVRSPVTDTRPVTHMWGTRTGVGVILYF